ncbi:hypothetical protein BST43_19280 [Mycobacteroides saopaulense]|uniref:Uncharacterized protein n=1 Tax=Mycobacteroides saopaulense TaxID=1578165 RepID=A0A1S4VQM2_9MYCO|nr:hypothetical protein [Mycobacteroides saopaulense]ALR10156.1 hypothetical protein MYCSP_00220 [Mycobacteroides saopaulense]ORB52109.1 hypothetical protein BST43_19280 [Mycobacteroides saopaulense]
MPDPYSHGDEAGQREAQQTWGAIRWQEPGITTPRPPTVAESRARDKARRAREAERRLAEVQAQKAEERRRTRNNVLMGSVVVAGIAAVVAVGYAVIDRDDDIEATCVQDGSNVVAPEEYCERGTQSSSGGVFIYAGSPYRYYYGGRNQGIGTIATGGTLELPKGTTARTGSGTKITKSDGSGSVSRSPSVSRGGFGSSSSGSSGS